MATAADLATGIANIQADDQAIAAAVAAVTAAVAGLKNGTVSQAELDDAVAKLNQAHTDFSANAQALNTLATP